MILIISNSGEFLPVAWRMRAEGTEVKVYLHDPAYAKNYDGILAKVAVNQLKKLAAAAELVIIDITRINERTPADRALLQTFGLPPRTFSVFGPVADKIRQTTRVIGAAAWSERVEFDRQLGEMLARRIGLKTPKSQRFGSSAQAAVWLKKRRPKKLWVLKPLNNDDLDLTYVESYAGELLQKFESDFGNRIEGDFLIQEKIKGAEISTEAWWTGSDWINMNHTLESKRLMAGDLGMAVGSQINCVWLDQTPMFTPVFKKLSAVVGASGYVGPVDINCIVKDGEAWFLEFTPRLGYDALYCLLSLLTGRISDFFLNDFKADFRGGFACSQRISIPPYPYDDKKLLAKHAAGVPINDPLADAWWLDVHRDVGQLKCAGADGILGILTRRSGTSGQVAFRALDRRAARLKVGAYLQYRSDAAAYMKERYNDFQKEKR